MAEENLSKTVRVYLDPEAMRDLEGHFKILQAQIQGVTYAFEEAIKNISELAKELEKIQEEAVNG